MNELIVKKFRGKQFCNFVWNDRPCWIATDVAEIVGYSDKSRPVFSCIKKDNFEIGVEYEFLQGEDLKLFKSTIGKEIESVKYTPKLIIFYEAGLYGFLQYTEMPVGIDLRNWIRREVIPSLREKGYYIMGEIEDFEQKNLDIKIYEKDDYFDVDKFQRIRVTYESAKMFKELLDNITKDSTYKFLLLKKLFVEAGIDLPKYIEEELID